MLKVGKYANLPGIIGFGLDFLAQGGDDVLSGSYSAGEIIARSAIVGVEGQGIGWLEQGQALQ